MSIASSCAAVGVSPKERLEVLFAELAELTGQRNAADARIVQITAEIEREGLCGITGARSVAALVAWKTGSSSANAHTIATVAHRLEEFPRCAAGMAEGRLSLDQLGVIAAGAGPGSDEHYAALASVATVNQLRTAVKLEPRPDPAPGPAPQPSITKTTDEEFTCWRIKLPHEEAATFDAALASHRDALIAEWKQDHADGKDVSENAAPLPGTVEAFLRLVETGWDLEAARRPHGQHTTVVVHLDVAARVAALHLGPLLSDAERQYLTCDATCEVWFERDGQPLGAGRSTRVINRRLRRALEHRDRTCVVPGCAATRGLHAHHMRHWEDGGLTELANLVLVCPYHHRAHHRGLITLTGPADKLTITDSSGQPLRPASLARPPKHPPPAVPPCPGPTGERANWWWYQPFQPQPQPPPPN
ncbi:HNH endonuclease signature motif containing protein [Mycobacterium simiae]|uniref:HNH endonuclease signature motif containing protein n=1 Tax=Mycobacterium simiae TaxID=1784 RepID=UPI00262D8ECB|nr:HNH endonuclease signature motif containing protein [Mycobacterium simiae]